MLSLKADTESLLSEQENRKWQIYTAMLRKVKYRTKLKYEKMYIKCGYNIKCQRNCAVYIQLIYSISLHKESKEIKLKKKIYVKLDVS